MEWMNKFTLKVYKRLIKLFKTELNKFLVFLFVVKQTLNMSSIARITDNSYVSIF